jgi:hypothetical protein
VVKPKFYSGPTPLPLLPPPKLDKPVGAAVPDEHRATDGSRTSQVDDKVATLRAYRKARGLCQYCAKKYARGHKCAPTIPLRAVQELWKMLQWDKDMEVASEVPDTEH